MKFLYPLLRKESDLGRKCVLTAWNFGGVLTFVKDRIVSQRRVGTCIPLLISSGETKSGALCPALGTDIVVQKMWMYWSKSRKSYKDDEGFGVFVT